MKKLLFILAFAALVCGCSKDKLSKGTYFASTPKGNVYVELKSGDDCILYFKDGEESSGYYDVEGSEITIIGFVQGKDFFSYRFSTENPGTITGKNSFRIKAEAIGYGSDTMCNFEKR